MRGIHDHGNYLGCLERSYRETGCVLWWIFLPWHWLLFFILWLQAFYGESSSSSSLISFFNSLLFYRLIFACGGAATSDMLTVVLGDYAAEGKRSKLAGLLGVSTGFGACFGALFLNRLPTFSRVKLPANLLLQMEQFTQVSGSLRAYSLVVLWFLASECVSLLILANQILS